MTTCLPLSERQGAVAQEGSARASTATARLQAQRRMIDSRRQAEGIASPYGQYRGLCQAASADGGPNAEAELRRLAGRAGGAGNEREAWVPLQLAGQGAGRLQARPPERDRLPRSRDGERPPADAALPALHAEAPPRRLEQALRQREPDALQLRGGAEARG